MNDEVNVSLKKQEEYIICLLKELHSLFSSYYDVFIEEDYDVSSSWQLSDVKKGALKFCYNFFFEQLLYWVRFFELKRNSREK